MSEDSAGMDREIAELFTPVTYDAHVMRHAEAGTVPLSRAEWEEVMNR